MSIEPLDDVGFEFKYFPNSYSQFSNTNDFSKAIFAQQVYPSSSGCNWFQSWVLSECENKTKLVAQKTGTEIKPMNTNASGEVKIEASWGDKNGPQINIGASGQINDNKGNYVKGEIKQDSNGNGSASISAGKKEK